MLRKAELGKRKATGGDQTAAAAWAKPGGSAAARREAAAKRRVRQPVLQTLCVCQIPSVFEAYEVCLGWGGPTAISPICLFP